MREKGFRIVEIVFGVTILLCIFLLIYTLLRPESGLNADQGLSKVNFTGTYKTNLMSEPEKLTKDTKIDAKSVDSVEYIGHLDRDIEKNVSVMIRAYYISGDIFVNGEKMCEFGHENSHPSYVNSAGNGWVIFGATPVKTTDEIKLIVTNNYENNRGYAYDAFINNIYVGNSNALFVRELKENWFIIAFGLILAIIGMWSLLIAIVMKLMKIRVEWHFIWLTLFMLTGGIWVSLDYDVISFVITKSYFNIILEFVNQIIMVVSALFYIRHFFTNRLKMCIEFCITVFSIFMIVFLLTQVVGPLDGYQLNSWFTGLSLGSILVVAVCIFYQYKKEHDKKTVFLMATFLPVLVGGIFDIFNYRFEFLNLYMGLQTGLYVFIVMHSINAILVIKKKYEMTSELNKLESKLMENSINTMISQIQPHFMFNCLTAIQQLCYMDPERAEETVADFAVFLRGNLDALRNTALVPFSRELTQIKHYINLEKMRFDERVNIEYHLEETEFMLPSISVQPMVENAVRYGITKKLEGGIITISTSKEDDGIKITVEDDGVGFDVEEVLNDGKQHLGIATSRERIKAQCNGNLKVESVKGKGTKVTIWLPLIEIVTEGQ